MAARNTNDAKLLSAWAKERRNTEFDELIARCEADLAQAQCDLTQARAFADKHAVLEDRARFERQRLTEQFEKDIQATAAIIGESAAARNGAVNASYRERQARARLQHHREQLEELQ